MGDSASTLALEAFIRLGSTFRLAEDGHGNNFFFSKAGSLRIRGDVAGFGGDREIGMLGKARFIFFPSPAATFMCVAVLWPLGDVAIRFAAVLASFPTYVGF